MTDETAAEADAKRPHDSEEAVKGSGSTSNEDVELPALLEQFHTTLLKYEDANLDTAEAKGSLIDPAIEDYLKHVAKSGIPNFEWSLIRAPVVLKFDAMIKTILAEFPFDHLPPMPNVQRVMSEDYVAESRGTLLRFKGIPFTIQRICELLTDPTRHYKRADKVLRALRKNLMVVGCILKDGTRDTSSDADDSQNRSIRSVTPEPPGMEDVDESHSSAGPIISTSIRPMSMDTDEQPPCDIFSHRSLSTSDVPPPQLKRYSDESLLPETPLKRPCTDVSSVIRLERPPARLQHYAEEQSLSDDPPTPTVPLPSLSDTFRSLSSSNANNDSHRIVMQDLLTPVHHHVEPREYLNHVEKVQENVVSDSSSAVLHGAAPDTSTLPVIVDQCEADSSTQSNSDEESDAKTKGTAEPSPDEEEVASAAHDWAAVDLGESVITELASDANGKAGASAPKEDIGENENELGGSQG